MSSIESRSVEVKQRLALCRVAQLRVAWRVANDGPKFWSRFDGPKSIRYSTPSTDGGYVREGFYLRRLIRDHNTPAVRLPREVIRRLGWNQGTLLAVSCFEGAIVLTALDYKDPEEGAHAALDEARRECGARGAADDHEGGA